MHTSILPTLTSVCAFAALASAVPRDYQPPQTKQTCFDKARQLTEWTAANISYSSSIIFTTPAHQVPSATIKFTLINPALEYKVSCQGTSSQLSDFFYGNLVYNCDVPNSDGKASFTFNRPTNELQVNQSWSCADEGSSFTASGHAQLFFDCNEDKWQNPNWPANGGFYSRDTVSCNQSSTPVHIDQIVVVA